MAVETINHNGTRYAEIIWSDTSVETTTFFSPAESSFQFGLLAHAANFTEQAYFHKPVKRVVEDLQQMFIVQRGKVEVQLYTDNRKLLKSIILSAGDAIVLIHGIHSIKVIEDMQCISVKQGPFLGTENDKIIVEVEK